MAKRLVIWLILGGVLLMGSGLVLTGCAPQSAIVRSPLPTPQVGANGQSDLVRPYLITPLPGETVRVGEVTEVAETRTGATPVPPRYAVRTEQNKIFVRDSETGQEIRLGSDDGSASFGVMTDQYIIWRFDHFILKDNTDAQAGLHAYVLATGQDIPIAGPGGYQWYPKIDGQWVIYLDISNSNTYFAKLRAHYLITGEDFQIGNQVPFNRPSEYYAISGDRIAWVEVETRAKDAKWLIRVYDLTTRTAHTLNVPDTTMPSAPSLSGDIVVWEDGRTKGYDLKGDAPFTIPLIPQGWENLPVQPIGLVTVHDDHLYWSLSVNKQIHHVTAPIIRDK